MDWIFNKWLILGFYISSIIIIYSSYIFFMKIKSKNRFVYLGIGSMGLVGYFFFFLSGILLSIDCFRDGNIAIGVFVCIIYIVLILVSIWSYRSYPLMKDKDIKKSRNITMLRNIEKIKMDNEVMLSVTTDTDFDYTYREQDTCKIRTDSGKTIIGKIINIGDSYIEIQAVDNRVVKLSYSSIEEIEGI